MPVPGLPQSLVRRKLVNLTGHPIRIYLPTHPRDPSGNTWIEIEASGIVCRVLEKKQHLEDLLIEAPELVLKHHVPVTKSVFTSEVVGLPKPIAGVYYIVSRLVAEIAAHRDDLIFPDDSVRGESTRIMGCRAFQKASRSRRETS